VVWPKAPTVGAPGLAKEYNKNMFLALRFPEARPKAPTVGAGGSLQFKALNNNIPEKYIDLVDG